MLVGIKKIAIFITLGLWFAGTISVHAITVTELGGPLDASSYPGSTNPGLVEATTPPSGTWTTVNTDMTTGQEVMGAGYSLPEIATCDAAQVTQLRILIPDTSVTLNTTVTDQQWIGVSAAISDRTSPFTRHTVSSLISGTHSDGAFAVAIDPGGTTTTAVRGFTSPTWTTVTEPIPGSIEFEVDTTGMTAANYRNLALAVNHDLYDGPRVTHADAISSEQPIITVSTDDSACNPVQIPTAQPSATPRLANTGTSQLTYTFLGASVATVFIAIVIRVYNRSLTRR